MRKSIRQRIAVALAAVWLIGTAAMGADNKATRSVVEYTVPRVTLVRDDGKTVSLPDELNDGRPVVMSFIFTSCTTICPLLTQTLARLQDALGPDRDRVHIVSITLDPEEDTPERLTEYAKDFHAGPEWQHYTGTVKAIITTTRAFSVDRGDKMSHTPVILLRLAPGKPWIRFDGFATAAELLRELRTVVAASK